jgi:hypothetical protein
VSVNTVVVHRCYSDIEANQIKDILEQAGITCQVASDIPHTVFPVTTDGLGEVRVSVVEREAERARQLINDFLETPPELPNADEFRDTEKNREGN